MTSLCYAVLAHADKPALERFIFNLRTFSPEATLVIFNGGRDLNLTSDLAAEVCPYSRPLRYGNLAPFHLGLLRWLHEERRSFDYLVTLEPDMALLKPGYGSFLEASMRSSMYAGAHLNEVRKGSWWLESRGWREWKSQWRDVLGIPYPFHARNPGQVYRRDFVERVMLWPRLPRVVELAENSRMFALEEMLPPTLAAALDCNPSWLPGSHAIGVRRHAPAELESYLDDPRCYFVHRVGTSPSDPEQEIVRALMAGERPDFSAIEDTYVSRHHPPLASWGRFLPPRARARAAKAYRRVLGR